jgi:hypothetical protein
MTVTSNFTGDVGADLADRLRAIGYERLPTETHALAMVYFNVLRRRIPVRARRVRVSEELRARTLVSSVAHQSAIQRIVAAASSGGNLNPYLSHRLLDPGYYDLLLDDWGIHHLHLGDGVGLAGTRHGFVERTRELLFAIVTSDDLYLIDVLPHGVSFADDRLLEIVLANWPQLLEPFCLRGVQGVEPELTREERYCMRQSGVMTLVQLSDGRAYAGRGGGYSTARTSITALMLADRMMTAVHALEADLRARADELRAAIRAQVGRSLTDLRFSMMLEPDHTLVAVETQVGVRIGTTHSW